MTKSAMNKYLSIAIYTYMCMQLSLFHYTEAWVSMPRPAQAWCSRQQPHQAPPRSLPTRIMSMNESNSHDGILDFDSLMDMDIVLYSRNNDNDNNNKIELGAMQEDGTLAPLSTWTDECSFDNSLEFLVDEEDRFPGLTAQDVRIVQVLNETVIAYGSRQVGGGMGPGNPHGEESEICYYVDQSVLGDIEVVVKPELEIFW